MQSPALQLAWREGAYPFIWRNGYPWTVGLANGERWGSTKILPGGVSIINIYSQEELSKVGDNGEGCRSGEDWKLVAALQEESLAPPTARSWLGGVLGIPAARSW